MAGSRLYWVRCFLQQSTCFVVSKTRSVLLYTAGEGLVRGFRTKHRDRKMNLIINILRRYKDYDTKQGTVFLTYDLMARTPLSYTLKVYQ